MSTFIPPNPFAGVPHREELIIMLMESTIFGQSIYLVNNNNTTMNNNRNKL
jgi:hypothetical protein